jgi:hypothetical protein
MTSFTFPVFKAFVIMGIVEMVLGVLIIVGILRSRSGIVGRIIGGAVLIVFGVVFLGIRNTGEIRISEGSMELRIPFGRDKVIATQDIISVREVNILQDGEYRPVRKVSGGKIGDVRTGWFRLSNGEKAFLTLEGPRALYIETTLGFNALVGANDFEAFDASFIRHVYNITTMP